MRFTIRKQCVQPMALLPAVQTGGRGTGRTADGRKRGRRSVSGGGKGCAEHRRAGHPPVLKNQKGPYFSKCGLFLSGSGCRCVGTAGMGQSGRAVRQGGREWQVPKVKVGEAPASGREWWLSGGWRALNGPVRAEYPRQVGNGSPGCARQVRCFSKGGRMLFLPGGRPAVQIPAGRDSGTRRGGTPVWPRCDRQNKSTKPWQFRST